MMTLSNTATPYYYGLFRDAVLRGEIPVNREVSAEMNRIDALIANPGIWYDSEAVNGFIAYCEGELTLTDGTNLHLLPTFKLWAEQIFGWFYYVDRSVWEPGGDGEDGHYVTKTIKLRLTKKQFLIVARGAAKSMYAECIQAFFLDDAPNHDRTYDEAGRRGHGAVAHCYHTRARTTFQILDPRLNAEHDRKSDVAAEAGRDQEGHRELLDRIASGDPSDDHREASRTSPESGDSRRVVVRRYS